MSLAATSDGASTASYTVKALELSTAVASSRSRDADGITVDDGPSSAAGPTVDDDDDDDCESTTTATLAIVTKNVRARPADRMLLPRGS